MFRINVPLALCFLLASAAVPLMAQQAVPANTQCAYNFTSGNGNTFLNFCVTVNGNIPQIETPSGIQMMGFDGEGYGLCNESPAQNYTDYGVSDTGNWNAATLVSKTNSSVKIARTTSDGNWTLTQTITKVPKTASITVVMALTNNQSVDKVAYLVRFAHSTPAGFSGNLQIATIDSVLSWTFLVLPGSADYGLQLKNVGTPQFAYMQGFVQNGVQAGPNACAFAFNAPQDDSFNGSMLMAFVGTVPTHGTKTVTLTYRGL